MVDLWTPRHVADTFGLALTQVYRMVDRLPLDGKVFVPNGNADKKVLLVPDSVLAFLAEDGPNERCRKMARRHQRKTAKV